MYLCNIPSMSHVWEVVFCYSYQGFFNLTCPNGNDSIMGSRKREHANSIKQSSGFYGTHRPPFVLLFRMLFSFFLLLSRQ